MLDPYRRLLAVPGLRRLMVLALIIRIPVTATNVTIPLHVVLGLGHSYTAAGAVTASFTVGNAIGNPLVGRLVDRWGLRPTVIACGITQAIFWSASPWLPYSVLLIMSGLSGMLTIPVFAVIRQAIAAMVTDEQSRTAYSMDAMGIELAFIVGPAAGLTLASVYSTRVALLAIAVGMVFAAVGLYLANPPVRGADEGGHQAPPLRSWLTPRLVSVLVMTGAALMVLIGSELALIAATQRSGHGDDAAIVFVVWCAASAVGGFVHGALRRSLSLPWFCVLLCLTAAPAGLFAGSWWALTLAFIPIGLVTAPTIATTGEAVNSLAPPSVRGLANGLHGTAVTTGGALGSPLVGYTIDHAPPQWAFAAAPAAALLLVALGLLISRFGGRRPSEGDVVQAGAAQPAKPSAIA